MKLTVTTRPEGSSYLTLGELKVDQPHFSMDLGEETPEWAAEEINRIGQRAELVDEIYVSLLAAGWHDDALLAKLKALK